MEGRGIGSKGESVARREDRHGAGREVDIQTPTDGSRRGGNKRAFENGYPRHGASMGGTPGRVEARAFQKGRDRGGRRDVMGSCTVRWISMRFLVPRFRGDAMFGSRQQGGSRPAARERESGPECASFEAEVSGQASERASVDRAGRKAGPSLLYNYSRAYMQRRHNKQWQ